VGPQCTGISRIVPARSLGWKRQRTLEFRAALLAVRALRDCPCRQAARPPMWVSNISGALRVILFFFFSPPFFFFFYFFYWLFFFFLHFVLFLFPFCFSFFFFFFFFSSLRHMFPAGEGARDTFISMRCSSSRGIWSFGRHKLEYRRSRILPAFIGDDVTLSGLCRAIFAC